MLKHLQYRLFLIAFCSFFTFTVGIVNQVNAGSCALPGSSATAAVSSASVISSDLGTMTTSVTKKLATNTVKVAKRIVTTQNLLTSSLNSVGTTATHNAAAMMKSFAKVMDTYGTKVVQIEKEFKQAEVAINKQPSASDCVQATGLQYRPEAEILAEAVGQTIFKEFMNIRSGVGSDLSISDADNSIAFQADLAHFIIRNFCNPEMNGGLVPTEENPIQTANGPIWCGMDRGPNEEFLVDYHLKLPALLGKPALLPDNPKVRQGVSVAMLMLLGMPQDKINLADLRTAAGQRNFVQRMKQQTRKALPVQYLSEQFAKLFPVVPEVGSEWARQISIAGLAPEAVNQKSSQFGPNISLSQFEEALVKQYQRGDYFLDIQGMPLGQLKRQELRLMSQIADLQEKRRKEAEMTNYFMMAMMGANS